MRTAALFFLASASAFIPSPESPQPSPAVSDLPDWESSEYFYEPKSYDLHSSDRRLSESSPLPPLSPPQSPQPPSQPPQPPLPPAAPPSPAAPPAADVTVGLVVFAVVLIFCVCGCVTFCIILCCWSGTSTQKSKVPEARPGPILALDDPALKDLPLATPTKPTPSATSREEKIPLLLLR